VPLPVICIKTRILLVALVGVIETDNPVKSTKEVLVVENVSVLVVLTTCNTFPARFNLSITPDASGKSSVRFVFELGLAMVKVPVPELFPSMATFDKIFSLTSHQHTRNAIRPVLTKANNVRPEEDPSISIRTPNSRCTSRTVYIRDTVVT